MKVRYQRTHITAGVGPPRSLVALLEVVNIPTGRGIPLLAPTFVDTVGRAAGRDTNVLMREEKLAEPRVQSETVYSAPCRID
jgi:hypothetical protein